MNNHERTGAPHAKRAMAGWASRLFVLTILAALAGVFEAQGLVVGPFDVVGSYDGFFLASQTFGQPVSSLQGTLAVKVLSADGRLTAKATVWGRPLNFRASAWDAKDEYVCTVELTARGGEKLSLLVINGAILSGGLQGGSLGGAVMQLIGGRNRFSDLADTGAQALLANCRGYYTMALPPGGVVSQGAAQAAPLGYGYLTMTVGSGGRVKIAGLLADGTRVSQSTRLILYGGGPAMYVPFFVKLYRKSGWFSALLVLMSDTGNVGSATTACWDKPGPGPDGFQMTLGVYGKKYVLPPPLATEYLFFAIHPAEMLYYTRAGTAPYVDAAIPVGVGVAASGMRLVMDKGVSPVKNEDGTYTYPAGNSALATLTFSPVTGIFKGKFNVYFDYADVSGLPVHKKVKASYAGVMTSVPEPLRGTGFYLLPDNDPSVAAYRLKRSFLVAVQPHP